MENKTGIVHKFAYSFFDFKAYKDFLSQGLLKALFYLFIVSTIFSTLGNISTLATLNDDVTRLENKYVKEAPEFELKNGVLSIDSKEPVVYKYTGDSPILNILIKDFTLGDVLIADTNGTTDVSSLDEYNSGTYINSTSIHSKKNGSIIASINFSENTSIALNKDMLTSYFSLLKVAFALSLLIVGPMLAFINNLAAIFIIIGPMTLIFSKNSKENLGYLKCCIISIYSITLPLVLESLATITNLYSSEFVFVFYIVAFLYSSLAVKNLGSHKKIDTVL